VRRRRTGGSVLIGHVAPKRPHMTTPAMRGTQVRWSPGETTLADRPPAVRPRLPHPLPEWMPNGKTFIWADDVQRCESAAIRRRHVEQRFEQHAELGAEFAR